jgi:tetratricopeptide (TPR) repeat protein
VRFISGGLCLLLIAMASGAVAQTNQTKAQLEVSETMFTLATALNSCGYDSGLEASLPLRQTVRAEIEKIILNSPEAATAQRAFCAFHQEHVPAETGRDLSQYISLVLDLGPPPEFKPTLSEADLPPDAGQVLGSVTLLQNFYRAAGIHAVWQRHESEYDSLVRRFHDPVSSAIIRTDLYLHLSLSSGGPGKQFVVYMEPLFAPSQVNSRNYGESYFLVVSPGRADTAESLRLNEIRHTYLHYVLDPLALKYGRSLQRIEPILETTVTAPLSDSYKQDISLLVSECLIRAIEARLPLANGPANAEAGNAYVQRSVEEGFVLTRYFYDALAKFEKESTGLNNAYGDLLFGIDVPREKKRASETIFARQSSPEVMTAGKPITRDEKLLDAAEQQLAAGDAVGAQKLATDALKSRQSVAEPGRAFFILARASLLLKDLQGSQAYFERAIQSAHDPRTLAWSHIYLGRILDIQDQRESAVTHYRAALSAGDPTPDTRAAAEKGINAPYQPQSQRQP